MGKILISTENVSMPAELMDTPTARRIVESLPLEGEVNRWGEEIYFHIPLQIEQEPDAREEVEVGDLGYWPAGPAFCIFFGPTPVSQGNNPKAYSPVNVFGRMTGDPNQFQDVSDGVSITISLLEAF
jgi:hypothetical protein